MAIRTAASEWLKYKTLIELKTQASSGMNWAGPTVSASAWSYIFHQASEILHVTTLMIANGPISERNFIILANRHMNCFIIHLENENLPCKCSGSIFRTSALCLEWSDIYSFWETPTHGGCWRLTAVYHLITAGVKRSYKTMTMETNNRANHLLYVWNNQFAWFLPSYLATRLCLH